MYKRYCPECGETEYSACREKLKDCGLCLSDTSDAKITPAGKDD